MEPCRTLISIEDRQSIWELWAGTGRAYRRAVANFIKMYSGVSAGALWERGGSTGNSKIQGILPSPPPISV